MKFEVIENKKILFVCTDPTCIPDDNTIKSLSTRGCKFFIDGKKTTITQIKKIRNGE